MEMESKRACIMPQNDGVGRRSWEELNPEILGLIFAKIVPVKEMVRSVCLVCRGWMEAVAEPYCWTEIDVEEWCLRRWKSELGRETSGGGGGSSSIDTVVRKLVRRSRFTFRKLSACRIGNVAFSYVANCGRCLKILHIRVSEITDEIVEKHAESLVNLTELDISFCLRITSKGIEAFGRHCRNLTHLKRNMPPGPLLVMHDYEALSIAQTMQGLHHLELEFCHMSKHGLDAILTHCNCLTYLDIWGCNNIEFEGDLERRCENLLTFIGPLSDEDEDEDEDDNDDETSSEESGDNKRS